MQLRKSKSGTDNEATMLGFTVPVLITAGDTEFAALIKPRTDRDEIFDAFNTDDQVWVRVKGWTCEVVNLI